MIAAQNVARRVSSEIGLSFDGRTRSDGAIVLSPKDHARAHTFELIITPRWRSLEIQFEPGAFSGELVHEMGNTDATGRAAFSAVIQTCMFDSATVLILVNGQKNAIDSVPWTEPWRSLGITIRRGQLPIESWDGTPEADLLLKWTTRAAAAVLALLPLEKLDDSQDAGAAGLPEGAVSRIEVNRYERDRRNRAAALAIHGYACQACGAVLANTYGDIAACFIEIHHVTPVSALGPDYRINPQTDLVPLCPNCHSIIHRRSPPYSVAEVREMIGRSRHSTPDSK